MTSTRIAKKCSFLSCNCLNLRRHRHGAGGAATSDSQATRHSGEHQVPQSRSGGGWRTCYCGGGRARTGEHLLVGAAGRRRVQDHRRGLSWKPIFEKQASASIGAIALAPSNPSLIWVGTGEANPRNDMVTGHGVYFSPDAGASWRFMGLDNVGQISTIVVHPTNPDVVYVACSGTRGGRSGPRRVSHHRWRQDLAEGALRQRQTGASDLVMDPANPMVLFAGMWEFGAIRGCWSTAATAALSIARPMAAPLEEIERRIAEGAAGPDWAGLGAQQSATRVCPDRREEGRALGFHRPGRPLEGSYQQPQRLRGFYFPRLFVSPDNENHLYFLSFDMRSRRMAARRRR